MAKQISKPMKKADILKINPKIDPVLVEQYEKLDSVEQYEKLDSELRRLGIDTKPKFNIEPPLGGDRLRLFNE